MKSLYSWVIFKPWYTRKLCHFHDTESLILRLGSAFLPIVRYYLRVDVQHSAGYVFTPHFRDKIGGYFCAYINSPIDCGKPCGTGPFLRLFSDPVSEGGFHTDPETEKAASKPWDPDVIELNEYGSERKSTDRLQRGMMLKMG